MTDNWNSPPTASLHLILTNEFGDSTDIAKSLRGSGMDEIYQAVREALAGCGYAEATINEWFPNV